MQSKTSLRVHFISIKMSVIKKTTEAGEYVKEKKPFWLLVGVQSIDTTMEITVVGPHKNKPTTWPCCVTPGYTQGIKGSIYLHI